jgi:hypothetical protein
MTAAFDQKKQDIRELIDVLHRNIDNPIELAAALSALIEIVEDKPAELVQFQLEIDQLTVQKVIVSVDEEWLRQAVFVCEIAIENTSECLAYNRHKRLEPLYKKDMEYSKKLRALLRGKLGWPEIVDEVTSVGP